LNDNIQPITQELEVTKASRITGTETPGRSWALSLDSSEMKQFFELNPAEGLIVNKLSNSRVFILGADSWTNMERALFEIFSTGATEFLGKMGRAYGGSTARKLKPFVHSVSVLRKIAAGAGFGTFTIQADEETGNWIRVNSQGCVFCQGAGSNHDCSFLSGMVQGMAEEFYNKQYLIIRRKCYVIREKHTCEVVLQESYYDPVGKRRKILERTSNPLGEEFR
jgi:predicted hydrocarbon binding protein